MITAGTRLGPYEITAAIGAGGMGEVYRGRDGALNRDVAIKVLPAALAADPERMARFKREAQVLASLNHPNIAAIFGMEVGAPLVGALDAALVGALGEERERAGTRPTPTGPIVALVMELVEGEDLSERLKRGAIPVDESIAIAKQIAEGLEEAHEHGIIHRDLKPANVKVTADGKVKILDFGLAKAMEADLAKGANSQLSHSPTVSRHMTEAGMIMGTAAYMSPEQARGKPLDRRADIWSFGVVLFEMLSGTRLFAGETVSDTLAAVLKTDPDWSQLPADTPAGLRGLIRRCLERAPRQRLRDIGEARLELERIQAGGADPAATVSPLADSARRTTEARTRGAMAAGLIAALAMGWWFGHRTKADEPPWSNFSQLTDASGVESGPTLSPDGNSFAYSSAVKGSADIYVQRVGGRNPVLVAGDPNRDEVWPAFSPDGKLIAFNQGGGDGGIFIVGATGESARRLTDFGANPAWSPDGQRIVFSTEEVGSAYSRNGRSSLWTADLSGGAPVKLDEGDAIQPAWSPSGKRIAFWQNVGGQRDLATIPANGGPRVLATSDAATNWAPVWSPDGRFLYFASDRGGSMGIWRIGIEETSGHPTSEPQPVAAGVDVSMDLPHLSADGTSLVFRSMISSVNPAAIPFDPATERAGAVTLLQHRTAILVPYDASADGQWIALTNIRERQEDLFIMRPDGTELSRVTDDLARDRFPYFTPDGMSLTFFSNRGGKYQGWSVRRDGGSLTQLSDIGDKEVNYTFMSPDGRRLVIAFASMEWIVGPTPGPLTLDTATLVRAPPLRTGSFAPSRWSRDGRFLSGKILSPSGVGAGNALYEVASGTIRELSEDANGESLAWMPDQARVVYFVPGGRLMIQDIESLARREIAVRLPLPPDADANIVASPDGRTLYYGAQQTEANIWMVRRPEAMKK